MPPIPSTAMTANHSSITGANALPIVEVPKRCTTNKATRITTASGITNGFSVEVTTLTPSRALSTEIAGVMTPSP